MESGPVQLLMSFSFICSPNHRAFYKSTFNLSFPFENIVTTVFLLIMSSLHILGPYLQMWGLRAPETELWKDPTCLTLDLVRVELSLRGVYVFGEAKW